MAETIKVLSIDGGGIRGVIPAVLLSEIEKRAGRPIADLFDLVAGTSTGGILALGLTVASPDSPGEPRYSADELLELYEREGSRIFHRPLWHRVVAAENLIEEKYPSDGVEDVLGQYFGDSRLTDARTNVFVTAYEIERRRPFFFKSHRAQHDDTRNFFMREAARATSAAPTYFEPAYVPSPNSSDYYALVDGGVFANNPALCAYVEARRIFEEADDFLVVSLGTGELTRRIPYEEAKAWGLALWAQPLLGVVFDGVSDSVDFQLQRLCRDHDGVRRYYRFQTILTEGNDDMDDATRTNIRVLKLLAEDLVAKHEDDIEELCKQLVDRDAFERRR